VKDIGLWIGLAIVGIAIASALLFGTFEAEPQLAPEFTLRSLDGADVSIGELRGSVVILDFWATWCKPCTKTFPELHALAESYADREVILLVVSLDKSEARARDHLVENGFSTDNVLWGSLEEARAIKALYDVIGIPRTFVIDRAGYIRFSGYPTRVTAELIESLL
jgi:thiol-disulfide isomerase/thioredoxin